VDLYSATLGLAIVAFSLSAAAALSARLGGRRRAGTRIRLARLGALTSMALALASLLFHLLTGHQPGSPGGMGWAELLVEHPSFAVVAVLAALVLGWSARDRPPG